MTREVKVIYDITEVSGYVAGSWEPWGHLVPVRPSSDYQGLGCSSVGPNHPNSFQILRSVPASQLTKT